MEQIKSPIFVIRDDGTVLFLHEPEELNYGHFEPEDVADGLFYAYDSEGQQLDLKVIEKKYEHAINIPFLGKLILSSMNETKITAIPSGIKDQDNLIYHLSHDLSEAGHDVYNLTLDEMIKIYQQKYPKLDID